MTNYEMKPIKQFNGEYMITTKGEVINIKKDTFEFDKKYLDMFEKAKKCNYEDETIGII